MHESSIDQNTSSTKHNVFRPVVSEEWDYELFESLGLDKQDQSNTGTKMLSAFHGISDGPKRQKKISARGNKHHHLEEKQSVQTARVVKQKALEYKNDHFLNLPKVQKIIKNAKRSKAICNKTPTKSPWDDIKVMKGGMFTSDRNNKISSPESVNEPQPKRRARPVRLNPFIQSTSERYAFLTQMEDKNQHDESKCDRSDEEIENDSDEEKTAVVDTRQSDSSVNYVNNGNQENDKFQTPPTNHKITIVTQKKKMIQPKLNIVPSKTVAKKVGFHSRQNFKLAQKMLRKRAIQQKKISREKMADSMKGYLKKAAETNEQRNKALNINSKKLSGCTKISNENGKSHQLHSSKIKYYQSTSTKKNYLVILLSSSQV